MTTSAGDFVLAADMTGLGNFASVGTMRNPSAALLAAVIELQNGEEETGPRSALIHALATKIAGHCVFQSPEAERAVVASFSARIVMEWRLTIPWAGALQALFIVARLQSVEQSSRLFDLVLQLAGKPAFDRLAAQAAGSQQREGSC